MKRKAFSLHPQTNALDMIKGVITGDLVNSTNISSSWRQAVVDALNGCITDFAYLSPAKIEMYRGDSFQVVVDKPEHTLTFAIGLRTILRSTTPKESAIWDARVSVGIGDISYESDKIVTSDGEAFRLSGRRFDNMGKRKLCITTPWADVDNTLELNTRFADEFVSSWTAKQSRVVYRSLLVPKSQKDMADDLGMSRQNFNYHWVSSKGKLIVDYLEYCKSLIVKNIPQ